MMLKDQKVLVSTIGVPHPSKGASVVLFFHYIKALVDQGCFVFHIISHVGEKPIDDEIAVYKLALGSLDRVEVVVIPSPTPLVPDHFKVVVNLANVSEVREAVSDFQPTHGLAFDVAAGNVLNQFSVREKSIWLGDLLFKSNWYNYLYSFREDIKTLRWLPYALVQTYKWKKIYKEILSSYSHVIVSSKSSEKELMDLGISSTFYPYPWPSSPKVVYDKVRSKPKFLFFGSLVGLGSRSSLHFLFRKIYPLLIEKWGADGFEILIGGREAPRGWMVEDINKRPEIKYIGFIEDLAVCMKDCHAVIAPLDVPVGNRSRILTAWSMGALVVTHENAALGNPSLIDGETAYLAKTANEFAAKMVLSVEKPEKSHMIIDQAQDKYLKEYSIEAASHSFVNIISKSAE